MFSNVSVLFPFGPDNGPRSEAFEWVLKFYDRMFPEVEICIVEINEQPFPKARAINQAAEKATRDIFLIADTDLFFDPDLLNVAVKELESHAWVLPFARRLYLDKESSKKVISSDPQWPIQVEIKVHQAPQVGWGLLNVVPRKFFEAVNGFDERFVGWGGEDDTFAVSLNTLCGPGKRLNGSAYHLWHPQGDMSNYGNNLKLLKAYLNGRESVAREIEKRRDLKNDN